MWEELRRHIDHSTTSTAHLIDEQPVHARCCRLWGRLGAAA
jgi:hypothetical protein